MTPDQVKLVQQSFAQVAPIADTAAGLFYQRLFEIAPAVEPLFHGDMAEQRRKLMATLAVVVGGLGNIETVLPAASALAKRHVDWGVKPEHYDAGRRRAAVDARAGSRRGVERATSRLPGRPPTGRSPDS